VVDRAVFINYRGEDSHSYGALLYRDLTDHFGEDLVFLDAESIPAGADFANELLTRVRAARVLLAVIGRHWLTVTDPTGRRRIDDPADWIRRELAEAFAAGVRVIPVLIDQAELPPAAELPVDIAALGRCQYRHLRRREPTAGLARILTDLTSLDPVLAAAAKSRDNTPRQLPAAPALFIGRVTELATLTDATMIAPGATVVISAIGGAGGVGKTALALHWAYQHLNRFPDGQLYVNLHGFGPSGQSPTVGEALRGLLTSLGADPSMLPDELDAQASRYRSLLAGKQMLIVLDNARDIDQVIPLLPGSSACTVLITSRHRLTGLTVLHGARLIDLDVLPERDARELLARHLGAQRLAAEPDAVTDLLVVCAGLPLAVRIVAARAVHHPTFPLAVLADELRDASTRLDGLDAGDLRVNVRAVLSWSVQTLGPQTARMFGLLGVAPGMDISLPAAVSLADRSEDNVLVTLGELENAFLVQQHLPGRYRMHDLIRLYATDAVHRDLAEEAKEAALRRLVDFYIQTAFTAERLLYPHDRSIQLDRPAPGVHPQPLTDIPAAMAWLDAERPVLLAAQQAAASLGWNTIVWQLAWALDTFLDWRGFRHDRLAIWQDALDAAAHISDPTRYIHAHRRLGAAYLGLGSNEEGFFHLHQALALAEDHHYTDQQAFTHRVFAGAWEQRGDDQQALQHATRARDIFHALDRQVSEADALNMMGWCAARLGEYDTARSHCQAALTLHHRHHHTIGEAATLDSLGYIAHHAGQHQQAIDYYQRTLILCRSISNTYEAANTSEKLGHSYVALGEYEQTRVVWWEALRLYKEQGRDADTARVQQQLADLDKLDGHVGPDE
jgi:tetratricopeptide (TPR) repeat protein